PQLERETRATEMAILVRRTDRGRMGRKLYLSVGSNSIRRKGLSETKQAAPCGAARIETQQSLMEANLAPAVENETGAERIDRRLGDHLFDRADEPLRGFV
ncbi:MAG: hypothetical protein ACI9MB_001774, partial [Verrucomicrobiales bacterium]